MHFPALHILAIIAVFFSQFVAGSCFIPLAERGVSWIGDDQPTRKAPDSLSEHRHQERGNGRRTVTQMVAASVTSATALWLGPQQLGEFEPVGAAEAVRTARWVQLYDYSAETPIHFQEMWDVQKLLLGGQLDRLTAELKMQKRGETPPLMTQFLSDENGSTSHGISSPSDVASAAAANGKTAGGHDSIIMLQHKPVYTLGTGSDPDFIKSASEGGLADVDVVRIERGGEVTYHGPGQLVVYPILDLRGYRQDIHWYMRALEEAILVALESAGVKGAMREDDVTGVWVSNRKIAALGVKVRRWVTMHGLAVNVDHRSIANFKGIVPCGLVGRDVTCVNDHLEEPITVDEFALHMKSALEHVFEVRLRD